jgi:tetratricopeptide (TPR) repeat protein
MAMRIGSSIPPGLGSRRWFLAATAASALAIAAGLAWRAASGPRRTPDLVRAQIRDALLAGRPDRTEEGLAWLARHDRLTTPDQMARARVAQLRGRPDEAIAILEAIHGRDPVAARARLMAGLIHLERDRARLAEATSREALEIDPELRDARYELIRIYGRQQRLAALDEQCRALIDQRALDFERLNFWALTRNASWNAAEDLTALARWVEADPDDRASRLALAEGLRRTARADRAREVLSPLGDSDPDALALRAQIALDLGERDEAARLLAGSPAAHAGLSRLRGLLALTRGDARAAARELIRAYRMAPDDRQTLVSLGVALTRLGDPAAKPVQAAVERLRAYDAIVSRLASPDAAGPALFRQIGAAAEGIGRRAEARAWYGLAIDRDPLLSEAQQAYARLGPSASDIPPVDFNALPSLDGPRPRE